MFNYVMYNTKINENFLQWSTILIWGGYLSYFRIFIETGTPLPKQRTSAQLREDMRDRIEKGEYQMGELIVPRLYRIVKIDKDTNTTVEEEIEISGRKVPLLCIRQNLQKKFLDTGIVRCPTLDIPNLRKD